MSSVASFATPGPEPRLANRGEASAAARLGDGRRASGILAHDLNNLLGVILSANERLAAELPNGGEAQRLAELALEAAERGAELLRRGLAQTRADDGEAIDGQELLDTVRRMAGQAMPDGVRLKVYDLAEPLSWTGDRTGLEMALLNLCLNAGQATPEGGRVVVQAREVQVGEFEARRLGLRIGAFAAFTVRDTGKGMSPEILKRAIEPLFTTRPAGTGLGLTSVRDFLAAAGGALALQSREGHGTAATIYLPLA